MRYVRLVRLLVAVALATAQAGAEDRSVAEVETIPVVNAKLSFVASASNQVYGYAMDSNHLETGNLNQLFGPFVPKPDEPEKNPCGQISETLGIDMHGVPLTSFFEPDDNVEYSSLSDARKHLLHDHVAALNQITASGLLIRVMVAKGPGFVEMHWPTEARYVVDNIKSSERVIRQLVPYDAITHFGDEDFGPSKADDTIDVSVLEDTMDTASHGRSLSDGQSDRSSVSTDSNESWISGYQDNSVHPGSRHHRPLDRSLPGAPVPIRKQHKSRDYNAFVGTSESITPGFTKLADDLTHDTSDDMSDEPATGSVDVMSPAADPDVPEPDESHAPHRTGRKAQPTKADRSSKKLYDLFDLGELTAKNSIYSKSKYRIMICAPRSLRVVSQLQIVPKSKEQYEIAVKPLVMPPDEGGARREGLSDDQNKWVGNLLQQRLEGYREGVRLAGAYWALQDGLALHFPSSRSANRVTKFLSSDETQYFLRAGAESLKSPITHRDVHQTGQILQELQRRIAWAHLRKNTGVDADPHTHESLTGVSSLSLAIIDVMRVFVQLAKTVNYAHAQGVVLRTLHVHLGTRKLHRRKGQQAPDRMLLAQITMVDQSVCRNDEDHPDVLNARFDPHGTMLPSESNYAYPAYMNPLYLVKTGPETMGLQYSCKEWKAIDRYNVMAHMLRLLEIQPSPRCRNVLDPPHLRRCWSMKFRWFKRHTQAIYDSIVSQRPTTDDSAQSPLPTSKSKQPFTGSTDAAHGLSLVQEYHDLIDMFTSLETFAFDLAPDQGCLAYYEKVRLRDAPDNGDNDDGGNEVQSCKAWLERSGASIDVTARFGPLRATNVVSNLKPRFMEELTRLLYRRLDPRKLAMVRARKRRSYFSRVARWFASTKNNAKDPHTDPKRPPAKES
ncbi:hypothetical protein CXG81DRAFT_21314 [Caulochytrium protostelioides]|uniref:Protein kinase domain-containing protein n=1 Tax=Caulochytrium protostelioides TaxID=1555241 RepID=A0A4P9WY76_9FUNG|nr:hypothetical protein CXG81DRAFT_21314 [Caulochytrium protostelioides]|eukprot:RKO98459.1 hypothetical protein CXG81DRAFT_21314 [Caulochytrium protostelioides]